MKTAAEKKIEELIKNGYELEELMDGLLDGSASKYLRLDPELAEDMYNTIKYDLWQLDKILAD